MSDDLRDAALDAFKRSLRGGTEESSGGGKPASSGESAPVPETGAEEGKGTRSKPTGIRSVSASGTGGRPGASGGSRPRSVRESLREHRQGPESSGSSSRVLVWLNLLLLLMVVVLIILVGRLSGAVSRQESEIGALRETVDRARQVSLAKFGVYRDENGVLQGVYVNYEKPDRYRIIGLKSE